MPAEPPPRRGRDDSGFTLVETIVAIGLISTVMAAVTTFMVDSLRATDQQRLKQVAVQLADGAVDFARNVDPAALPTGRVAGLVGTVVSGAIPGLSVRLSDMEQWNAPLTGVTAALPVDPVPALVNGTSFTKFWFLGRCWQPAAGGTCAGPPGVTGSLQFYRVVAAVTWRHKACGDTPCSYITSTLVNTVTTDPLFNTKDAGEPPLIVNPGGLATDVGIAVDRQMDASGGTKPWTWYSVNLPPGLTMGTDGKITGTPTTAGSYQVTVTVKDANGLLGTADLTWFVNPPPLLAATNQITAVGTVVALTPTLTFGTAPYRWAATGLPAGLTIDAGTGTITGTPAAGAAGKTLTSRVTVTDVYNLTSQVTFTWQVVPALVITAAAQTTARNSPVNLTTNAAAGGSGTYVWTATGLPDGLTIDTATGVVRGTPTRQGTFPVVYTVTDTIGSTASVPVNWRVT